VAPVAPVGRLASAVFTLHSPAACGGPAAPLSASRRRSELPRPVAVLFQTPELTSLTIRLLVLLCSYIAERRRQLYAQLRALVRFNLHRYDLSYRGRTTSCIGPTANRTSGSFEPKVSRCPRESIVRFRKENSDPEITHTKAGLPYHLTYSPDFSVTFLSEIFEIGQCLLRLQLKLSRL